MSKRMKYSAKFKLQVVNFAEETNNCAASRKFGVNEKLVRDWKRNATQLAVMPRNKCANRGKSCQWPALEQELVCWVEEQRKCGFVVTRNMIRLRALACAKQSKITDFKGTISWCSRFLKRNDLVLRQRTKLAQKLPEDLEEKITLFQSVVIKMRKKEQYDLSQIGNMDETPVWFDMPTSKTVSAKGEKTVLVRTTGHEKSRFTVVLSCLADGTKLKPMVVFKRKTLPKGQFPSGVVIHNHPKGWMDEEGIKIWIEKVWNSRPGGMLKKKSLLVWDSFKAHLVDSVKRKLKCNNTDVAVIPGGLTSVVQPLDVSLNKPFKDRLRGNWSNWMIEGEKQFTKGGAMKAPSLEIITGWIKQSWDDVSLSTVERSFKKCCISNALDGTEDDLIWEEEEETEDKEDQEDALYDDRLNENEWNELFGNSDDEDGF